MTAHIQLPALDAAEFSPATLSQAIVTGLLREQMNFEGLVVTDSMGMDAVSGRLSPGDAAVRAIKAGNDIVLHSPDDDAAVAAIRSVADGLRDQTADAPAGRRCASCGTRYTLRFTVRGLGGEAVTTRLPCPGRRCGKHVQVQVPRNAERVRLEEATAT